MPSCCQRKKQLYLQLPEDTISKLGIGTKPFSIPDPGCTFKTSAEIMPYDVEIISGNADIATDFLLDEKGWMNISSKDNIRIYAGYKIKNHQNALFKRTQMAKKNVALAPDTKSKFSFAIFFLGFIASIYAHFAGKIAIIAFCAVLMCVCPCLIVLTNETLNLVSKAILYRKGIHCNGNDLISTFKKLSKVEVWSDYTGTLTNNNVKGEDLRTLRPEITQRDGKLHIGNKQITKIISGYNKIQDLYKNAVYSSDKGNIEVPKPTLYLGNGFNDASIFANPNIISCAVYNSPKSLKDRADFVSTKMSAELANFTDFIPNLARKILGVRNFLYLAAFIYCISVIPLTVIGVLSPMYACLALCTAGSIIVVISQLINMLYKKNSSRIKISKNQAILALRKMVYKDRNFLVSPYSKEQVLAQVRACGIKPGWKNNIYFIFATTLLLAHIILGYIQSIAIQNVFFYSCLPVIIICLWPIFKEAYKRLSYFVVGSLSALAAQKIAISISVIIAGLLLTYLYHNPMNMYEIQLSAIIILGLTNLTYLAKIHTHHLFLMALMIVLTKQIKSTEIYTKALEPLKPCDVPDYRVATNPVSSVLTP